MPSASSAPTLPFLERLLDGEKVEWKTLGEVFHTRNGYTPSKTNDDFWEGGTIPWFRMDDIRASGRILNDSTLHITPQAVKKNGLFKANSIILATSATVGEHAFLQQDSLANQRFTNFEIRDSLKEQLLPKFVFYYFFLVDEWCKQHLVIGNFPSVDVQQLISLPFPIPPLRVQSRIVEILDKFTQLEAELEAELEARNKQYDFYRNRLLDFALRDDLKGQVEWKTLGEVCVHLRTGLNPRRNFKLNTEDASNYYVTVRELGGTELLYSEKTDLINDEALQLINNRSKLKVNDILFSGTGTIGKTAFISKEPTNWNIKEGVYALTLDTHYVLPMFVLRYLQTQSTIDWIDRMAAGGIVRSITMKNLEQLPIPLPPLSEQRRIVDILDRFDTLTNSISEGLPREIALRRKQYEYYRDALLRFPPPAPTA